MKTTRFTLPTQALALTLAMLAGFALGGCGEKKGRAGPLFRRMKRGWRVARALPPL